MTIERWYRKGIYTRFKALGRVHLARKCAESSLSLPPTTMDNAVQHATICFQTNQRQIVFHPFDKALMMLAQGFTGRYQSTEWWFMTTMPVKLAQHLSYHESWDLLVTGFASIHLVPSTDTVGRRSDENNIQLWATGLSNALGQVNPFRNNPNHHLVTASKIPNDDCTPMREHEFLTNRIRPYHVLWFESLTWHVLGCFGGERSRLTRIRTSPAMPTYRVMLIDTRLAISTHLSLSSIDNAD